MRLEVNIWRKGRNVMAEIVHQDEGLRTYKIIVSSYDEKYHIESCDCPEIDKNVLFIRGRNSDRDIKISTRYFNTEQLAIDWCKNINELIDEINKEPTEELSGWVRER